jgi:hypothetical protein
MEDPMSAAQENRASVRIDDDIELLTEQITALKELGHKDKVDDDDVYDLSIRWGTALAGRLPRLVHYNSLGSLDEADQLRFQSLCDELRSVSDLIDRFAFAHPVFDDTPSRRTPRRVNLLRKHLGLK